MSASRAESWGRENDNEFKYGWFQLWETLYTEVVRDGLTEGEIIPLLFGKDMDDFLKEFFSKQGFPEEIDGIKITS
ncbi:hypothetical protein JCM16358_19390 [Halanaerocella petrolearia]